MTHLLHHIIGVLFQIQYAKMHNPNPNTFGACSPLSCTLDMKIIFEKKSIK